MAYQPKSYRKFLATSVAAAVVATAVAPSAIGAADHSFSDVEAGVWYEANLEFTIEEGIIEGFPDDTFRPREGVTRAQAATMVKKALDLEVPADTSLDYTDTVDGGWYEEAIAAVSAADIMEGDTAGTFRPNDVMTRGEFAAIMVRAYGLELDENAVVDFNDLEGEWSAEDVKILASLGIVEGMSEGVFSPDGDVQRDQSTAFIHRTAVDAERLPVKMTVDSVSAIDASNVEVTFAGEEAVEVELSTDLVDGATTVSFEYNGITYTDVELSETFYAEALVTSVSAINAKKLQVTFNQAVDKDSAEDEAKYSLNGAVDASDAAVSVSTATLSEDGKTVTLTLDASIANENTFVAIVDEITNKNDASVTTEKYTTTISFNDTTKPSYSSVTYPEAGTAVLHFTEDLSNDGTVKVYDGSTDVTGSLTVSSSDDDNQIKISGLSTDKEYKVVVVGSKDQSGNLLSPNPVEVSVESTVSEEVAPTIQSVSNQDLAILKIEFSEKLKSTAGSYATVNVDGTVADGAQSFDTDTNTLTVALGAATPTAGIKSVEVTGYTDLSNNDGADYSQVLNFKATAPALTSTDVVTDGSDKFVVLTFDEAVNQAAAQSVDITGTYTTPSNVLKSVVTADIDETTDVTVDPVKTNKLKIKVTDLEAGAYDLVVPKAGVSDGTTALSEDLDINFTLSATSDLSKPNVSAVFIPGEDASAVGGPVSVPLNTVYVKYSKDMSATALNTNNYAIDGYNLIDEAVFIGDETLAKLSLKSGALNVSGDRDFTIGSAVKAENGVAIDSHSSIETLNENVMPELSSAELVDGDEIRVTFSEVMDASTLEVAAGTGDDFKVYIDGVEATITNIASVAGGNDDQFVITLDSTTTVTDLEDTVQVELVDGSTVTDVVGNSDVDDITITVSK